MNIKYIYLKCKINVRVWPSLAPLLSLFFTFTKKEAKLLAAGQALVELRIWSSKNNRLITVQENDVF